MVPSNNQAEFRFPACVRSSLLSTVRRGSARVEALLLAISLVKRSALLPFSPKHTELILKHCAGKVFPANIPR